MTAAVGEVVAGFVALFVAALVAARAGVLVIHFRKAASAAQAQDGGHTVSRIMALLRGRAVAICAQSPASAEHAHWVCGRAPAHTGLHIDIDGEGAWNPS